MKKGDILELNIEDVRFGGEGIATLEGLKIYVKGAFPGEKVSARLTKKRKNHGEARLIDIIEKAEYEIDDPCPHFRVCGGCQSQHVPYDKQLEFKTEAVKKLFEKDEIPMGEFLGIVGSDEQYEYRNKMEFSFGDFEKGGELCLGMHVKGSSFKILTTDSCILVDSDYRDIMTFTLEYFREKAFPHYRVMAREGYLRNLIIRKAYNTKEIMINLVTTSQIDFNLEEFKSKLLELNLKGNIASILHTVNDSLSDAVIADKINILYGKDYITEEILGLKFKISPLSFFQTNSKGAEKLYGLVREFLGNAEDKTIFDLYCGTGTIGQITAANAKKVIGVEIIEEAANAANENAKLNGLNNCNFIAGDVTKVIQDLKETPDIIILDPPRTGVHPKALQYVVDFNAKEIIYVSCNPKTLVQDLKYLQEQGYNIEKSILVDMFPNTPHAEVVVLLQHKNINNLR